MIKVKNKEIEGIINAFISLGNRFPVRQRFEITKKAMPFVKASETIQMQINQIINDRYKKDGSTTSIYKGDSEYMELMECEIEVDTDYIMIEEVEKYMPSMQELVALTPIIRE